MALLLGIQLLLLWQLFRILPQARALTNYETLVLAFVALSALYCLLAEFIGLGGWFTPTVLVFLHSMLTALLGVSCCLVVRRSAHLQDEKSDTSRIITDTAGRKWTAGQLGVLLLALVLALPPGLSAVFAPPSNWDSMTYHLPRVMHWLSQGSLDHYQTYIARQLYLNPGHEIILAHGIGVGGGDQYAGLLNSVILFVAMVAAAAIALRIGGGVFAQVAAVGVMGTIPMAILQASTTQNDLLHGLFLTTVLLAMIMLRQGVGLFADGLMWSSIGLAFLTKGLSFIWVPAIALVAFPWQHCLSKRMMKRVAVGILLVALLNFGFWRRNVSSFGHPLAPVGTGPIQFSQYPVEGVSGSGFVSNLARNLFLHSNIPFFDLGGILIPEIERVHALLGIDLNDSHTTLGGTQFVMAEPYRINEDLAGNGSTLFLAVVSLLLLLWAMCRRGRSRAILLGVPLLAAVSGAVVTCLILRWQPWGSRLQLPLFMLAAPGIAALLCSVVRPLLSFPVLLALVWAAHPYWIANELRPLLGAGSIISGDDSAERFYPQPHLHEEFRDVSERVRALGCRRLGIVNSEDDWEHGIFASLGMEVTVRSCKVADEYNKYLWLADRRFRQPTPCALIWFGKDAPEKVGACGRGYRRVEDPRWINKPCASDF